LPDQSYVTSTEAGKLEQIQFLLDQASVLTTERYLRCKKNLEGTGERPVWRFVLQNFQFSLKPECVIPDVSGRITIVGLASIIKSMAGLRWRDALTPSRLPVWSAQQSSVAKAVPEAG
jgi:hypothetical protein